MHNFIGHLMINVFFVTRFIFTQIVLNDVHCHSQYYVSAHVRLTEIEFNHLPVKFIRTLCITD